MIFDTERLDWLLQNVSGAEFRRLGIVYAAGCEREDIDAAMAQESDYRQAVDSRLVDWGMVTTGDAIADVAALISMELRAYLDPAVSVDASNTLKLSGFFGRASDYKKGEK